MNITALLKSDMIRTGSQAADKDALLQEIAGMAGTAGIDTAAVFTALQEREKVGSTGFGNGIAIPHCRLPGIDEFILGVVVPAKGIDFDALDGKKVRLAFFIIAPEARKSEHIQVLSAVSRVLHGKQTVEAILAAATPDEVRAVILGTVNGGANVEAKPEDSLLTIHVQDESRFNDIIQVFSESDDLSIAVSEAEDASYYLSKMPLFASFWDRKSQHGFHRIIRVVVKKSMANDLVRRIGLADEKLNKKPGVLVMVQDLAYVCGSLYL